MRLIPRFPLLFHIIPLAAFALMNLPALPAAPSTAAFRVNRVENGGLLFTDNPAGVSGTDAGYSLPMGDQTLWLFGDVFLLHPTDPAKPYVGGVSNTGLLVPAGHGVAPLKRYQFLTDARGVARPMLPNLPGDGVELRFWPWGGWTNPETHQAYLFYGRIHTTGGGGPFAFRTEGHGLARADTSKPDALEFTRLKDAHGDELWWKEDSAADRSLPTVMFGAAVVYGAPGDTLYIVGVHEVNSVKRGVMARVPKAKIEDSDAYEYLAHAGATPRWSRVISDSTPIEGLKDFPSELSVSWNRFLGRYLAVGQVGLSEKIRLSVARGAVGTVRNAGGHRGAPSRL